MIEITLITAITNNTVGNLGTAALQTFAFKPFVYGLVILLTGIVAVYRRRADEAALTGFISSLLLYSITIFQNSLLLAFAGAFLIVIIFTMGEGLFRRRRGDSDLSRLGVESI